MADAGKRTLRRCGIYTRKSSEEGLEQDFNSLHAQREACEAYVTSQKHEGWRASLAIYDDGGFSGGSMERPALQKLLADIAMGSIDVVVVYKVDRLTRSLTDFAKIVEVLDRHGVSFVSVTQAFNTTSSMGRLTLNVLLSFAQFEREVTGERIRDKIAASKKKGLWMGGFVPIGYEAAGRTLTINEAEAQTIRSIYDRYLELKSVDALKSELDQRGLRTKLRMGRSRRMTGGTPFSRGHLYRILSNPLYAGRINHKGETYEGQHPAIIDLATFEVVQATLAANSHAMLVKAHAKEPSLLTGLLFDADGTRLVASHARNQGRRYRYYVSPRIPRGDGTTRSSAPTWRLPASEIEGTVVRALAAVLSDGRWLEEKVLPVGAMISVRQATTERASHLAAQLGGPDTIARRGVCLLLVERIVLDEARVRILVKGTAFLTPSAGCDGDADRPIEITISCAFRRRGVETKLVLVGDTAPAPALDPVLIKAVSHAHRWWQDLLERRYLTLRDLAAAYATSERYAASVIQLAFLGPTLTKAILAGHQPGHMTLHSILKTDGVPLRWGRP